MFIALLTAKTAITQKSGDKYLKKEYLFYFRKSVSQFQNMAHHHEVQKHALTAYLNIS